MGKEEKSLSLSCFWGGGGGVEVLVHALLKYIGFNGELVKKTRGLQVKIC